MRKFDDEYYKLYADDLYSTIRQCNNDMPTVKLIKNQQHGIDKEFRYEKKLIDSHIINNNDLNEVKNDFVKLCFSKLSKLSKPPTRPSTRRELEGGRSGIEQGSSS